MRTFENHMSIIVINIIIIIITVVITAVQTVVSEKNESITEKPKKIYSNFIGYSKLQILPRLYFLCNKILFKKKILPILR